MTTDEFISEIMNSFSFFLFFEIMNSFSLERQIVTAAEMFLIKKHLLFSQA